MTTTTIPTKILRALLPFAAAQDVRYYMVGLAIDNTDPTAPTIVATDGHAMMVHNIDVLPDGWPKAVQIIPSELIKKTIKLAGTKGQGVLMHVADGKATLTTQGVSVSGALVDGMYPQWRRAIPDTTTPREPCDVARVDPRLVGRVAEALRVLGDDGLSVPAGSGMVTMRQGECLTGPIGVGSVRWVVMSLRK